MSWGLNEELKSEVRELLADGLAMRQKNVFRK